MAKAAEPDRWLSVVDAATEHFGGPNCVMRVYRRIYAGELVVSNVGRPGNKPNYKVSERSIFAYFADRRMSAPSRGLTT